MKMRHVGSMLVTVSAIILFAAAPSAVAASPKIGVVDAVGALQQSQWGRQATEEMKKEAEKLDAELDQKQKAFAGKRRNSRRSRASSMPRARPKRNKSLGICSRKGKNSSWIPKAN